jgi:transmembrane sensor
MKTVNDENSILITRVISGEASDTEHSRLENWLSLSAENREIFEQYKAVWNIQHLDAREVIINKQAAWASINEKIIQQEKAAPKPLALRRAIYATASVAALILLFIGIFTLIKSNENEIQLVHYTSDEAVSTLQLSDGSQVSLKQHATLSYPEDFKGDARNMLLSGEAYFEVAHNPQKPFIVETNDAVIKVLGTSFNIRHNEMSNRIEVAVVEGKVSLWYKQKPDNQLILKAGDFGTLDLETAQLSNQPLNDYNFLAWKTGVLEFNETELTEVLPVLENTYNLQVNTQKELSGLKLTARFSDESPEDIFKTIGILFNLKIEWVGKQVFIN